MFSRVASSALRRVVTSVQGSTSASAPSGFRSMAIKLRKVRALHARRRMFVAVAGTATAVIGTSTAAWQDLVNDEVSLSEIPTLLSRRAVQGVVESAESAQDTVKSLQEPAKDDLLGPRPAMPPGAYFPTLVLALEDTIVHTEWSHKHGHRTSRRPGLEAFLSMMSQYYEIVVFSSAINTYADSIIPRIDPHQTYISGTLYRDDTRFQRNDNYIGGKHIKDLSFLGRDLNQVVMIDSSEEATLAQPNNSILIPKWDGNPDDTALIELVPLLKALVREQPPDVRPVLQHMNRGHVPTEFAEFQKSSQPAGPRAGSFIGAGSQGGIFAPLMPAPPKPIKVAKQQQAEPEKPKSLLQKWKVA